LLENIRISTPLVSAQVFGYSVSLVVLNPQSSLAGMLPLLESAIKIYYWKQLVSTLQEVLEVLIFNTFKFKIT
jgi:hypothetical protein